MTRHARQRAGENDLLALPGLDGFRRGFLTGWFRFPQGEVAQKPVQDLQVARLREEGTDLLGHSRTDARYLLQCGFIRRPEGREGSEMPGEVTSDGNPDLRDPQTVEQSGELG